MDFIKLLQFMSKRRLLNNLKRKVSTFFNSQTKGENEWQKMREELVQMAKLDGNLILMMK